MTTSTTITVCTYNIHGGFDAEQRPSLGAIVQTLRSVEPDLCFLQEVDRFLPRSGFRDQSAYLARALGAKPFFYARLGMGGVGYGNAILSRLPVRSVHRLPFPAAAGGEPRGALGVILQSGMAAWTTHLGLHHAWRSSQLATLTRAVWGNEPCLVGGDFNATLDEQSVSDFARATGLAPLGPDETPTFPAATPIHRIDFLLGRSVTARGGGTIAGPGSDHCLVWQVIGQEAAPFPPAPSG